MEQVSLFTIISAILAFSAFVKVFFGIFFHQQLYQWARDLYNRKQRARPVNLLLIYALALLIGVWIATLTSYVPLGWILTAFITIASIKSLNMLFAWEKTSQKFVAFIDLAKNKLWLVDLFVAALGIGFLFLSIWVY
jgi:hypothetical protein